MYNLFFINETIQKERKNKLQEVTIKCIAYGIAYLACKIPPMIKEVKQLKKATTTHSCFNKLSLFKV